MTAHTMQCLGFENLRRIPMSPRTLILSCLLGLGVAGSGCLASGSLRTSAYVETSSPDLVLVSPGVYVIADHDQPVFY